MKSAWYTNGCIETRTLPLSWLNPSQSMEEIVEWVRQHALLFMRVLLRTFYGAQYVQYSRSSSGHNPAKRWFAGMAYCCALFSITRSWIYELHIKINHNPRVADIWQRYRIRSIQCPASNGIPRSSRWACAYILLSGINLWQIAVSLGPEWK